MKTEFILSRKSSKTENKEAIEIIETPQKTTFKFFDQEKYDLALKSKDFICDLYEFLVSRPAVSNQIRIRGERLDFGKLFKKETLVYLNKIHYLEKKEIISSLYDLSRSHQNLDLANRLSLFIINLNKLSKLYKQDGIYYPITRTLADIKKGRLLIERFISFKTQACKESYLGFIRAIRSNTLTTAKIIVNGKETRMFVKSPVGNLDFPTITKKEISQLKKETRSLDNGYNQLAIDPITFELYEVYTAAGKHYGEIAKGGTDLMPKEKKLVINLLKKELKGHLDNIYAKRDATGKIVNPGIQRMKETHRRMASKAK